MKKFFITAVVAILFLPNTSSAEVPDRLIYSGNLVDGGQPYEGAVDLLFSIHDALDAGTLLWSESHENIDVTNGKFLVELGLGDSLADVFDGGKYYLQVSVGGQVMLPRVPVASVPYAFKARKADDSDTVGGKTPEELGADITAADVPYANTQSGLSAENLQAALDEVVDRLDALQANYESLQSNYDTLQADHTSLQQIVEGISWNNLADIPADIADGDDVGMNSVSWFDLDDMPADIADGDDVGMTSVSWDDITDTANIIYSGSDFIFRSLNVRVQSGSGATDGTINGLGNLIVGYDEERAVSSDKSGSHNLVVGSRHNYSSYGGMVAGSNNTISGASSSVSGGTYNNAPGFASSVLGGQENSAAGSSSSVSGGAQNSASRFASSVSGGRGNSADGEYSSVSGGTNRAASGEYDWRAGSLLEGY